jgi:hypothetical protein
MNYKNMKKTELIEQIRFLKQDFKQMNISNLSKFQRLEKQNKRLKDRETLRNNEREDAIAGLFRLHSSILNKETENHKILEQIQYLIRYLG